MVKRIFKPVFIYHRYFRILAKSDYLTGEGREIAARKSKRKLVQRISLWRAATSNDNFRIKGRGEFSRAYVGVRSRGEA